MLSWRSAADAAGGATAGAASGGAGGATAGATSSGAGGATAGAASVGATVGVASVGATAGAASGGATADAGDVSCGGGDDVTADCDVRASSGAGSGGVVGGGSSSGVGDVTAGAASAFPPHDAERGVGDEGDGPLPRDSMSASLAFRQPCVNKSTDGRSPQLFTALHRSSQISTELHSSSQVVRDGPEKERRIVRSHVLCPLYSPGIPESSTDVSTKKNIPKC